ncbi:MAG: hypothetical protein PHX68_03990 [Alphaproteobacteria bacterium]|nr:hypothetical protein [Alphaproteobacteria bacterium]
MQDKVIIEKVYKLMALHRAGALGGETMPEDAHPHLPRNSKENYAYFTLPMALNYQRNSYKLWEAARKSFDDPETSCIFDPAHVVRISDGELRAFLSKHRVALQPNKHTQIWRTISKTIMHRLSGDLRSLFIENDADVKLIKGYVSAHKKDFPYLSGSKILNYWLYVVEQYTDAELKNRDFITIAPDTHVIQSSVKLGVITAREASELKSRDVLADKWRLLLENEKLSPIDVHTPLWLWSRGGFKQDI